MKNVRAFVCASLAVLAGACVQVEDYESIIQEFSAEIQKEDALTRTAVSEDFSSISWSQNDEIGIFDASNSQAVRAKIDNSTLDQPKAVFNPDMAIGQPSYSFHPYSSSIAGLEQNGMWLSTTEADGTFNTANIMAAVSVNNTLSFKNVVGIFRIVVSNSSASKIEVSAPGIAGRLHVSIAGEDIFVTPDAQNKADKITVSINGAGEYYIPVRPGDYAAGTVRIRLLNNNYYNNVVGDVTYPKALSVSRNQIINWSDPVQINNLAISNISCQGQTATFDEATGTFTLTLPTETQFKNLVLSYNYNGTTLTANGTELVSGVTELDASGTKGSRDGEYIVSLLCDGKKAYKLVVRNTGLPVVTVITKDGKPANQAITSKDDWVKKVTLKLHDANGKLIFETNPDNPEKENQYCQMKGRGNTTWQWFDKKPYAIKLEKKAGLVEKEKGKRWILLANFKDRTLLRNDAAFWLSKQSGLPYTVRGMYVELLFNGEHRGNYYLCEQIKPGSNRVNITEMKDNEDGSTDPDNLSGGYLLECDIHNDEGANSFRVNNNGDYYYSIKEPDVDVTTDAARNWIKQYLTNLENSLSDKTNHSYEEYLDVDSAIDFFLMQELTSNDDFYNGGVHSTYLSKDRLGKVCVGPIWDFDYSTFLPNRSSFWSCAESGWGGTSFKFYYGNLLKDTKFKNRLIERWNLNKNQYKKLPEYIDQMAEHIRLSEEINHQMWPQHANVSNENENGEANMSFDEAVANIKSGFLAKWDWIDANISKIN